MKFQVTAKKKSDESRLQGLEFVICADAFWGVSVRQKLIQNSTLHLAGFAISPLREGKIQAASPEKEHRDARETA